MQWIVPDRSDRPRSQPEHDSRELAADQTHRACLEDGRPVVIEYARVDGFFCQFFYFDRRELEDASLNELRALLTQAGLGWEDRSEDGRSYASFQIELEAANLLSQHLKLP